jgi:predicted DNA-binding protein
MVVENKQLRERSIYVYLPSVEMAEGWRNLAKQSGRTVSKFVSEHVENSLKQEEDDSSFRPRVELIRQLKEKDEEIVGLTEESRLMKQLANCLDKELKRYRMQPFVEKEYQGVRSYDRHLEAT